MKITLSELKHLIITETQIAGRALDLMRNAVQVSGVDNTLKALVVALDEAGYSDERIKKKLTDLVRNL